MPGEVVAPTCAGAREVIPHGDASSERVRDETAGSDPGFLPLDPQSWAGLDQAGLSAAGQGRWAPRCSQTEEKVLPVPLQSQKSPS